MNAMPKEMENRPNLWNIEAQKSFREILTGRKTKDGKEPEDDVSDDDADDGDEHCPVFTLSKEDKVRIRGGIR